MPATTIGISMNYGYPGEVSRTPDCVISQKPLLNSSDAVPFGFPVVLDSSNAFVSPATTTITATNFAGIAVAEVKQFFQYTPTTSNVSGAYQPNQPCDVLKRGDVVVALANPSTVPTAGSAVYVRTSLNGSFPSEVVGAIRASADSGHTVQLTNAVFKTGLVDANNNTEITILYALN